MYRAHSTANSAWYFASTPFGRFNLSSPRGTCYSATDVESAVREKLRDEIMGARVVTRTQAEGFQVSTITASHPYRCAAVSTRDAVRHGIVRELCTMEDYGIPQQWAEALAAAGFDGIFYGSAYTTGDATAYALFGPEGAPEPAAGYDATLYLTGPEACAAIGIRVEDPPSMRELEIIA